MKSRLSLCDLLSLCGFFFLRTAYLYPDVIRLIAQCRTFPANLLIAVARQIPLIRQRFQVCGLCRQAVRLLRSAAGNLPQSDKPPRQAVNRDLTGLNLTLQFKPPVCEQCILCL